jgi:hypothetical protein
MPALTLVRIPDRRPLLRAGLERIAQRAGVCVVDEGRVDLVLRSLDSPADPQLGLDSVEIVVTGDGTCLITCVHPPRPEVWDAVRRVVEAAAH